MKILISLLLLYFLTASVVIDIVFEEIAGAGWLMLGILLVPVALICIYAIIKIKLNPNHPNRRGK